MRATPDSGPRSVTVSFVSLLCREKGEYASRGRRRTPSSAWHKHAFAGHQRRLRRGQRDERPSGGDVRPLARLCGLS